MSQKYYQIAYLHCSINADMQLYNFFEAKFWTLVENEGSGFYDDVSELRRRNEYYFELCIEKEAIVKAYGTKFVKGYQIRKNITGTIKAMCEKILRNELDYLDYFRHKMGQKKGRCL